MKKIRSLIVSVNIPLLFILISGSWVFSQKSSNGQEILLQEITLNITGMS